VDVARLAEVSQKTVSRVLNDEPYVSADVRRRVLEAAEQLGYRRNQAARALASGRTRSIGVVTLGTALYGPASLLMGIERAVREVGYTLRLANGATTPADPGTWPPSDPPCPRWPARSARRQRSPIHPALISLDLSTHDGTSPETRADRR